MYSALVASGLVAPSAIDPQHIAEKVYWYGIPLIDQGVIIGAIGVSGGTDSQDEVVSKATTPNVPAGT